MAKHLFQKGHPPHPDAGAKKKYTKEFIDKEADALLEWIKDPNNIFFRKFVLSRGYTHQRLSEFEKASEKFADALEKARGWQEVKLFEGGLHNRLNSGLVKFALINHHDWKEKQEISGNPNAPFAFLLEQADGTSKELIKDD